MLMTFEWKLVLVLIDDSVRCDAERGCRVLSVQKGNDKKNRTENMPSKFMTDHIRDNRSSTSSFIPCDVYQNCSKSFVYNCWTMNIGRKEEEWTTPDEKFLWRGGPFPRHVAMRQPVAHATRPHPLSVRVKGESVINACSTFVWQRDNFTICVTCQTWTSITCI